MTDMKHFPINLTIIVAAVSLLACEKIDNFDSLKNVKAEYNQPYSPGTPESKDPVTSFNNMYPDALNVEWDYEGAYWEVSFVMVTSGSRVEYEAWYDKDGNWLRTVTEIPIKNLPQYVWDAIAASEYSSAVVDDKEADYIETPDGNWYTFELEYGELDLDVVVTEAGEVTFHKDNR